ncbi:MAG: gliding motility lipoprotein GldB [Flavobacteriaceae bacterium]|nr:gliding motility lipoprotein GldB [Flavobacteriaceae bacterium]
MQNYSIKILSYFFLILFTECILEDKKQSIIDSIELEIKIERFDQKFNSVSKTNLDNLKKNYPFLFPKQFDDDFWIKKTNDNIYKLLSSAVNEKFNNLDLLSDNIEKTFKHLKYEFPEIKTPRIITVINNVDYQNKIILADSLLFISIDTYMGSENKLYQGIPEYIRSSMSYEFILPDIIGKFSQKFNKNSKNKTFISKMIYHGKNIYFKDIILPSHSDMLINEYTKKQYDWIIENEAFVWRYFIEKELLFVNDEKLHDRFLMRAPFSKFYLEIDNDSPPRIGRWIGWQIVKSFVNNNPEMSLSKLMSTPNEEIFNKSKYKPKKIWQ